MDKDLELLRRVLQLTEQSEAVHLLYLTSEWVAPLDAKLQLSLQSLAESTSGRVRWRVLQAVEADASDSSISSEYVEMIKHSAELLLEPLGSDWLWIL